MAKNKRMIMRNENFEMKEMHPELIDAYIGKRLKCRRIMLGLTQDEVASMIGVTFQQVQKYECGVTKICASRLFVLAKVLQVDIQFFFDGIEKEVPEIDKFKEDVNRVEEEIVKFDPFSNNDTLELINLYWTVKDNKRKFILELINNMIS